jgi:hypothetical protein
MINLLQFVQDYPYFKFEAPYPKNPLNQYSWPTNSWTIFIFKEVEKSAYGLCIYLTSTHGIITQKGWGYNSVVKCLPSMFKALGLIPSTNQ